MILKRPSFRRGGNSGIAMLRQRYQRGSDQSFLNPGAPKTIQDFYKDLELKKGKRLVKVLKSFLKLNQDSQALTEDMKFLNNPLLL